VIAEAGVNHNGSVRLAKNLIDASVDAGANAVKFQSFRAAKLVTRNAPKARYQIETTGTDESQWKMLRALELSEKDQRNLADYARKRGITFLSSPFDLESLAFLDGELDAPMLKIPSGEITNAPLLLAAARTGKPLIVSTGMCTLGDIETALSVLAFGYTKRGIPNSLAACAQAYALPKARRRLQEKITILHCTTQYPAPFSEVNLRAMDTLAAAFDLPVGYSDHTEGIAVSIAAAAKGATLIEKHFTMDKSLPGPDHRASLDPNELAALVSAVRAVEQALGNPVKCPSESELGNAPIARKSLVAAETVRKGQRWTIANLDAKRPGSGVSPMLYWDLLGREAERDYQPDEPIDRQ